MLDQAGRPRLRRWLVGVSVAAVAVTVTVMLASAGSKVSRPASVIPREPARPVVVAEQGSPRAQRPHTAATARRQAAKSRVAAIDLFRGLGSWVDIYETTSFADPERAVHRMRSHGVRTLYIETSNFDRPVPILWHHRQARFIDAAHRFGLKIVAWYLPGFRNAHFDLARSLKAVRFRTRLGQGFDGFALDIESPAVRDPSKRTRRLLWLSDRIRAAVGPGYPLGAIIPTPLGMQRNPTYWPHFPYRGLSRDYQVFQPMTYFTWQVGTEAGARAYTTACIEIIRREVGSRAVPIHVIGGISDESTTGEAKGFVQAIRSKRVIGASYYAFHGTTKRLWKVLRAVPDPSLGPVRRRR